MSDLIYKQDAKDTVDMALDTIDHVPEWVYDILLNSLDKVPSAQPRKKGKWIIEGHHILCNRCENIMCSRDREGDLIPRNFCPNCGADMRGEQE